MWFKCTFLFDAPKAGWGETWYLNKSTHDEAVQPCKNYAAIRAGMLGGFASIEEVRISTVDPPHAAVHIPLNVDAAITSTELMDFPVMGLLATFLDVQKKYQRTQVFRGVPDNWIFRNTTNGKYSTATHDESQRAFGSVLSSLRNNGFNFRDRSGEGPAGVSTNVTSFGTSPTGGRIQVNSAVQPAVGDYVTFNGVTGDGSKALKGRHRVKELVAGGYILETTVPTGANPSNWVGGTWRPKVTGYFPVYYGTLQRPISRDTGRPFGLRRGRRPAVKK